MLGGGKYSAWIWSLAVHAVIASGFLVTVRFTTPVQQEQAGEVIQAVAVDAEALRQREQARLEAERRAEEARQAELRRQREAAEAERRRQEEARQAELRRQEEMRRQAAEAEARRKAEEEARRQAEAERKRREAEARRQAEEEARRKAEEEARRKAEEERRRREAEEAARRAREEELRQQMEAEERRFAAIQSGMQAEWTNQITGKVMRNWAQPPGLADNFNCEFRVRQMPGGEVITVETIRCDNEVLRRSAEAAIWRASPLPPPPDPAIFDQSINVIFEPEE